MLKLNYKKVSAWVLMMALLLSMIPIGNSSVLSAPASSITELIEQYKNPNGRVLVTAHRGDWRHHPENSIAALEGCVAMGVDMFETDIQRTKDGQLIMMHDATLDRTTNGKGNIQDFTLEEIKQLRLKEGKGGTGAALTEHTVPTLEEFMLAAKGKILVNLDKWWDSGDIFEEIYAVLEKTGTIDIAIIKDTNSVTAAEKVAQKAIKPMYSPKASTITALNSIMEKGISMESIELVFSTLDNPLYTEETLNRLRGNTRLYVNTMWSGLAGTYVDGPVAWKALIDKGFNVIQTDRPQDLIKYLKDLETMQSERSAFSTIEAELFNRQENLTDEVCIEGGFYLKNITNGAYAVYEKVDFGNTGVGSFLARVELTTAGGNIEIRLDQMDAEPIGTLRIFNTGSAQKWVTMGCDLSKVTGVHDVYLKFTGNTNPLFNLNWFVFGNGISIKEIQPNSVDTVPGIKPELPTTVKAKLQDDSILDFSVAWEEIDPSQYAQLGEFNVKGTVVETGMEAIARVTVRKATPDVPMSGRKVWFKADAGVTKDSSGKVSTWEEFSGEAGHTAHQEDPNLQPVWVENVINGKPVLRFDGVNDVMQFNDVDLNNKKEVTLVLVSSNRKQPNNPTIKTGEAYAPLYFDELSSWGRIYLSPFQDKITMRFGSGVSQNRGALYNRPVSIGSAFTSTIGLKKGKDEYIYVNGQEVLHDTDKPDLVTNNTTVGFFGKGKAISEATTYFDGDIAEAIIYDRALTALELADLNEYLNWRYFPYIISSDAVSVTTEPGTLPQLPSVVTAVYNDGQRTEVPVVWENIDPIKYAVEGRFIVKGAIQGTEVAATAEVTVAKNEQVSIITAIQKVIVTTEPGTAPQLPSVVTAVYSDGRVALVPVVWENIDPIKYAVEGRFIVKGTIQGTEVAATAEITVAKNEQVSIITAIQKVIVTTEPGTAPQLPSVVTAVYSDGRVALVPVVWDAIPKDLYAHNGSFTVEGSVQQTSVKAVAEVCVEKEPDTVNEPIVEPIKEPETKNGILVEGTQIVVTLGSISEKETVTPRISSEILQKAWEAAVTNAEGLKIVTIDVQGQKEGTQYSVELVPALFMQESNCVLTVKTPLGSIDLSGENIKNGSISMKETLKVEIAAERPLTMSENSKVVLKDRPAVQIKITADSREIRWKSPLAAAQIALPYTPTGDEANNTEHITVVMLDKGGNLVPIPGGRYVAAEGKVRFPAVQAGEYGVAYVWKTFEDLSSHAWAQKSIEVMASKGIIHGNGDDHFAPEADITRADWIELLVRTLGLTAEPDVNFTDIKSTDYYYRALGIAKKLGIAAGEDGNKFNPEAPITRQDLIVFMNRALNAINRTTAAGDASVLEKFVDGTEVDDYAVGSVTAMINAGLIQGNNRSLEPSSNATRAECAVIIYRLYNKLYNKVQ